MRPKPPLCLWLAALLALPLLVACVGTASPEGWAPPVETDDALILSLDRGRISSVSLVEGAPGQVRWTFPNDAREEEKDLDPEGIYPAPIVTPDAIFVATLGEGVFALDPTTGLIIWRREDLGTEIVGAFTATPNADLVVGTSDGSLHILDAATGDTVSGWPLPGLRLDSGIWASIAVSEEALYVATMGGYVHALDITTGQLVWSEPFETDGAILDLALLPNGILFVPSLDRHVYLLDATTGEQRAKIAIRNWVWMQPAVSDGLAFFGDLGGVLYGLDITTGELRWELPSDPDDGLAPIERVKAQPILVNDILIVADRSPAVHFLEPTTGRRLNRVPIDASTVRAPVVEADGIALVLSTNGKLFRANPAELSVVELRIGGAR